MSTPIETAAEAVIAADLLDRYVPGDAEDIAWDAVKVALASLAQHRDDIARVIYSARPQHYYHNGALPVAWDDVDEWLRDEHRDAAAAVLALLTGEAS